MSYTNVENNTKDWEGIVGASGGQGSDGGENGEDGSVNSLTCQPGYFGFLCERCHKGYYSDDLNSSKCKSCKHITSDAKYTEEASTSSDCEFECPAGYTKDTSERTCYSPVNEFMRVFGGQGYLTMYMFFATCSTGLAALFFYYLYRRRRRRTIGPKFRSGNIYKSSINTKTRKVPIEKGAQPELTREDLPFHDYRLYLLGDNHYHRPWSLPTTPPVWLESEVLHEEFTNFAASVNGFAAWKAWEHYVYNILRIFYHPVGRIFLRWRRKLKYIKLREFISSYSEVLWRKVEARQVSNSLRIACSSDYTLCFFDIINFSRKIEEWDEQLRLPMYLIARGEGSFFNPYKIDHTDLMVQLLAFHIEKIHSAMLFRFWEEVNCIIRCIHLRQPFPDLRTSELDMFTELCDRFNNGFFQFNGLEVIPCIYSAPIFIKQGRYVPFVLPKSANSQQLERKSAYMQLLLERSNKVYTYKPGLIVTATSPTDSFLHKPNINYLSFHWAPLMLRESDEITVRRSGVQVAREPETLPNVKDWYLSGLFFQKPRFSPYFVLFVMVFLVLWDFFTTCLLLLRYITEPSMHIELLFIFIMPGAAIIAPYLRDDSAVLEAPQPLLRKLHDGELRELHFRFSLRNLPRRRAVALDHSSHLPR
eukprot:CAMPEP_0204917228 /NCGR_PEP_ID=MMETSP1397-20131031/14867_1 /ASSEMBLY_ACC=CAM_ASM_000891 /TAXON_ID=49980 /ORGANISM="Climacostomum Climacostomum virens, Strain Stock W-24" /LENGTH=645 /DNA_ID=CAMNT_0052090011 /DNA_START=23 /DNA_END=1959 /DNA_ORIENTATION=+